MFPTCLGRFLKRIQKTSGDEQELVCGKNTQKPKIFTLYRCASCCQEVQAGKSLTAPCGHNFCRTCLRQMALTALETTDQFPVKCCGKEIPPTAVIRALGSRNRRRYTARSDEYAIPPSERLYCPRTKCGRWINPKYQINRLTHKVCPHCRVKICPNCRDLVHGTRECSYDPGLQSVLELAKNENWQRCFGCHAVVEKIYGTCDHVVCRCRTEFWYVHLSKIGLKGSQSMLSADHVSYQCGARYRSCNCSGAPPGQENVAVADADLDVNIVVAAMEGLDWEGEN
jgi:hypothetical protein